MQIISNKNITANILPIICANGPEAGLTDKYFSAPPLNSGGAMSILLEQVYTDTIHLVGRWWRDTMLHYLNTTMKSFTKILSTRMVKHDMY